MSEHDVMIVGGGIAGGALATVMARAGANVLLLERQIEYRDHVRGEILWPWGARLAHELGLEQLLLDAGGRVIRWLDSYDEGADGPTREDIGAVIPGITGSLNVNHPTACAALAEAAVSAGADVRMGVRDVRISPGRRPAVEWLDTDGLRQATGALVVGADGRRSAVRSQAGIGFEVDPPAHLVTGLLVEGNAGVADEMNVIARESDVIFYSFPQAAGRARLYLCFPTGQRSRFAGRDGAQRFLAATRLGCLNSVADWGSTRPAGPCATFPAEDSRAPHPLAAGVVLIGDAAGYENPLQGQGLSMALQDVHDVSAALRGTSRRAALEGYAAARATRQRLANLGAALEVWTHAGFAPQDPAERAARSDHIQDDDVLAALGLCFMTGFESLPQDLTHAELAQRLDAYSALAVVSSAPE
jgi:2-polyprenyl-6-methoxyphenol hydroxylase-like FAD-dependent oxidoreductase